MNTTTRLPARLRRLERQFDLQLNDQISFESELASFRLLMTELYDLDRGYRHFPDVPNSLELIMEWCDASEADVRRAVHELMPTFKAHVEIPSGWSPLIGMHCNAEEQTDSDQ